MNECMKEVAGFFLMCEDFLKNVQQFIPCLLFFFFLVEICSSSLIALFKARISQQWLSELRQL